MSSVIIAGDTSGSVTMAAPAVSGTTVITLPATTGTMLTTTSATGITSTVGTSATGAITIPVGTTAQRPASPAVGMQRVKTTSSFSEYYN